MIDPARRGHRRACLLAALTAGLALAACAGATRDSQEPIPEPEAVFEPAPPSLVRLTRAQFEASVKALLGDSLVLPSSLEPDTAQGGLLALGATVTTISPQGVELFEKAAMSLAAQAVADAELRSKLVPCDPAKVGEAACLRTVAESFGRRAWRRPLSSDEAERLATVIGAPAAEALDSFDAGVTYVVAAILQSPEFLYRVELGQPDPQAPGERLLTPYELASRLSFFLWNQTPDDALLDAAEAGELDTPAGLMTQARRLLDSPRVGQAIRGFFIDWLELYELDHMTKDPKIYRHYTSDLGPMAREETLRLVDELFVDGDANLGEFFTTRTAWVNRRLAAIYDIPAPVDDGFGRTELAVASQRRGYFGQVSFLGLHAHEVTSSPTLRGAFIREYLLCEPVPPPPSNLNTAIPEASTEARTLRERLSVHMENPDCAVCHGFTDPLGLGFENFDGIGRFRVTDHEAIIDATGDLDGAPFEDALQLGELVAQSQELGHCVVSKLYASAVGHAVEAGQEAEVDALATAFEQDGRRIRALMEAIVASEGFRRVGGIQ